MTAEADSADVPGDGDGGGSGNLQAGRSAEIVTPAARAFEAWQDDELRQAWLGDDARVDVRAAVPEQSLSVAWPDGTSVGVKLYPKGRAKCVVQVIHEGLSDDASVERMRGYWGERLERLRRLLEEGA